MTITHINRHNDSITMNKDTHNKASIQGVNESCPYLGHVSDIGQFCVFGCL